MRPSKEPKRRSRPSSPLRDRTTAPSSGFERSSSPKSRASRLTSPVSLLNRDLEELQELATSSNTNPRIFPYNVKQQCWEKAEKIRGRDPDRWRRDSLGNTVFRKLVGCPGCLCHDYDHIVPYSKGGQSTLDNCQVLQPEKPNHQYMQQSIDQKETGLSFLELSSFRKVPTVGFQVVTWILLNCQPMAMFVMHQIRGDAESNNNLRCCVTCSRIDSNIERKTSMAKFCPHGM
ncbi:uncharacterized protein LOC117626880 isoform X1 [Prunus dulcis]|uniref:uncharacterized protein LOC117626880 isoform X1 n=1 Tax=Prunus dulcis TaxID=3755 RepID=UPI001483C7E7|nr:uncharacterized protein LOC117626880 isoform X1 [Prunus dulcis]